MTFLNSKFILKIVLSLCLIALCSCTSSTDKGIALSFIPCANDDEMGFLDNTGTFYPMPSVAYDELGAVINGHFLAGEKLYKAGRKAQDTSNVLITGLSEVGIMSDGLIPVCKRYQNIDVLREDGTKAFTLSKYEGEDVRYCYSYSDSKMRVVLDDGYYVYIGKEGEMLFGKKYAWATDFKKGYAVVRIKGQNDHLFSLIDNSSAPIFTFESDDEDDISVSHDLELLCGRELDRMVIYNFKGKRVLECPATVYQIYSFLKDGFIFSNDNDEYGLMSYTGEIIIRAKYDQLVPNGDKFLASFNGEVDLIDRKDNIIKRFDGDYIFDFHTNGFDFPNIIEDYDCKLTMIDAMGNVIADELELDFDFDDLVEYSNVVINGYLPKDQIIDTIIEAIDGGAGMSKTFGGFFSSNEHCFTKDISFLGQMYLSSLTGEYSAKKNMESGLNYSMSFAVVFDEPIVKEGATSLNTSAWLDRMEITVECTDYFSALDLRVSLLQKVIEIGCPLVYNEGGRVVFIGLNNNYLYSIVDAKSTFRGFTVLISPNTSRSLAYVQSY